MAESGFSLAKLLNWLDGFLKTMSSPMPGWGMENVKVKQDGDNFTSYFQFKSEGGVKDSRTGETISNINGDNIELDVLLKVVNGQEVLSPLLSGLNNMSLDNVKEGKALLDVLFGPISQNEQEEAKEEQTESQEEQPADTQSGEQTDQQSGEQTGEGQTEQQAATGSVNTPNGLQDIYGAAASNFFRYNKAVSKGTGLLGFDFKKINDTSELPDEGTTYAGKKWSWRAIANNYLKYALECQVPGKNYGAIENVTLDYCSELISEYLLHEDVVLDASEVKVDTNTLVLPVLCRIQGMLGDYFNKAYENNPGIGQVSNVDTSDQDAAEAEAKAQAKAEEDDWNAAVERNRGVGYVASKRINVTLKKIQGSTEYDLLGLQSNYNPSETLEDLEDVVLQDEFINTLTEEPQTFAIDVDDDGYDISICEDCEISCGEGIGNIMKSGIKFYRNLYILHWMAKGNDMMKLHELSQQMYEELIEEIDTLGELMVEKCGTVISPSFGCDYLEIKNYEFQEGLDIIVNYIQEYLDCIDYAYPNQTSDVQSTFDEWIRYWNKQMKYFVERQEI